MQRMFESDRRRLCHQYRLVRNNLALRTCPRTQTALIRATLKIFVRQLLRQPFNTPFHAHLTLQLRPKKRHRRKWMSIQRTPLAAVIIRKENKTFRINFLQQHHTAVGSAASVDRRHIDRRRLVNLCAYRLVQPPLELLDRIVGAIAFRQFPFAVIFPNIVQIHLPLLLSFERFYPHTQTDFNRCTNFVPLLQTSGHNDFIHKHAA